VFVFIHRKRSLTHLKVLYFDRHGYCVWARRLEQGQFHYPAQFSDKAALDWTQLKLLLEGIDVTTARHYKRYRHPQQGCIAV
jgi:transposase